jgi:tetratricopeptide (TPR) repeat protein
VYGRLGDEENRARVQERYQDLMTRMEAQIYKNTQIAFYSNRGITRFNAGDFDGAIQEFQTAIDLNPKKAHGYYYLGMCYVQMGRPGEAVGTLEAAVDIAPDDERMKVELARAHAMTGNLARAADLLEEAISHNPYFDMPHYYLAGILRAQARHEEAQRHMAEFQRLRKLAATSLSRGS